MADEEDINMRSALHKATSQLYGSSDFICSLLDSGYSPDEKDDKGRTSLHLSASQTSQNSDIFQCLLESGGNPDETDEQGDTSLHKACRCNNIAVVEMILSRGCNLNHQNKMGRTALHVAASKVYVMPAIIRILLESGSNPDTRDKKGNTPFDLLEKARKPTPLYEVDRKPSMKLLKVKDLDKQAAKVFTRLLEEEGYNHFEARVMLAGEQGTGKSTIARYLVGKRPTRTRKSTDGIDLFNGLSFIERETKKWIRGKQGFTISELAISRILRQSRIKSSHQNDKVKLTYRLNISDTPNYQQLISKDTLVTAKSVKCTHVTSDIVTKETLTQDEHVIGKIDESFDVHVADASSPVQNQNLQRTHCSHEEYIRQPFISTSTDDASQTRCNVPIKPLNVSSGEYNVISSNKENQAITPLPVCSYTIPVENGKSKFSTIESPAFAEEMVEISKSDKNDCTSTIIELTSTLTDGDEKILASQDLTSPRLLSTTAVKGYCMQPMSLEKRNLTCDFDKIDGNENVKTAQHVHGKLSGEDVFYTRSMCDQFPVQDKCLENKYSLNLADIDYNSKPSIRSQDISCTKVVKNQATICKLKTTFGVKKDVAEIKVWMTKDKFLMKSIKAGKKKLHQKKIAPVIIWDFGGQDIFYSTHQTFLTYRAIYLIVLDGSRTLDEPCPFEQYLPGKSGSKTARDYLKFWINTIVTYCKGSAPGFPKIMVVLTHKDKLKAVFFYATVIQVRGSASYKTSVPSHEYENCYPFIGCFGTFDLAI